MIATSFTMIAGLLTDLHLHQFELFNTIRERLALSHYTAKDVSCRITVAEVGVCDRPTLWARLPELREPGILRAST